MRVSCFILITVTLFCGCSTVRKSAESHQVDSRQTDNSTLNSGYARETTTTETGLGHVSVPGDSISAAGYVPVGDTGILVAESDGMAITTTTEPVKDSAGKTVGNKIHTKATAKPKTVAVPVDKTTHIKETGSSNEKKDIQTTVKQKDKTTSKSAWRPSAGVQIIIGMVVIAALIFGIYKLLRRVKTHI